MAGWKEWQIGEVVEAADFQSYVQDQVVQVYADSTARGSALGTAVMEGMVAYLADTNSTEVYDGSSWIAIGGDITSVTAGTGLTGGGTSGSVTLNVNQAALYTDGTAGYTVLSNGTAGLVYQPVSPNYIINGAFDIWQRGTATATVSGSTIYTADRWAAFAPSALGVFTINQSTDVPSTAQSTYSLLVTCTTAEASLAASSQYQVEQRVEQSNLSTLMWGKAGASDITISFWVKSSLTGTYCVALRNYAPNRSYIAEYTINSADTWEKKSITVPGDTTGDWGLSSAVGLRLNFTLAAGTNLQTTANSWQNISRVASANQVNFVSSATSRTWQITGVQLEAGSVATPFKRNAPSLQGELAACQRYYWQVTDSNAFKPMPIVSVESATSAFCILQHPVQMRANPTFASSGSWAVSAGGTTSSVSGFTANEQGVQRSMFNLTVSGLTAGRAGRFYADNDASAFFSFSSEL